MPAEHEIRADFDRETIVVYQAFPPMIADAALMAQRFVAPFSTHRMTWIKPSFLWLMHRSNWGQKSGQERVLAVRITRDGWEKALSLAVPTGFQPSVFRTRQDWEETLQGALVHLQWDPERTLHRARLPYSSIQIGLSRHIIRDYVEDWVVGIEDLTPRVRKIHDRLQEGQVEKSKRHLPPERVYPVRAEIGRRLLIWGQSQYR